jgi:hypothetical protein
MRVGVQYRGQVNASATERVFTYNWPADLHVLWYVTPTNPRSGAPQIDFDTEVERASADRITYWIMVRNLTNQPVDYELRYAVLN